MSYLSDILASIGGDSARTPASAPTAQPPLAAQKRKADEQLMGGPAKRPTTPANVQNGASKRSTTPNSGHNGTAPKPKSAARTTGGNYTSSARTAATGIAKKPDSKAQTASITPLAVAKPVSKPATTSATPAKPAGDKPAPKKGSYAELMARAKAAQEAKHPVGVIMHKQTEKVNKKDRIPEGAKGKNASLRDKKPGDRSRTGSAEAATRPGDKHKPKPLEKSDYKGTAKPTTPIYTGSARPGQNTKQVTKRNNGYASWSDMDEDTVDNEEDDYGSDESDMEAGAFDIDREEEEALRMARREDAAELALENRLKAEKQARKKQVLQQLAAARAKKKLY